MQEQVGKAPRKRSKPSYIYSIISITLVLFMLGILGHVLLFSQKLSEYFRESIEISIILKDGLSDADIFQFQKKLEKKPYIKSTKFISKDDAAKILADGKHVKFEQQEGRLIIRGLPEKPPDKYGTVIALKLKGKPEPFNYAGMPLK